MCASSLLRSRPPSRSETSNRAKVAGARPPGAETDRCFARRITQSWSAAKNWLTALFDAGIQGFDKGVPVVARDLAKQIRLGREVVVDRRGLDAGRATQIAEVEGSTAGASHGFGGAPQKLPTFGLHAETIYQMIDACQASIYSE